MSDPEVSDWEKLYHWSQKLIGVDVPRPVQVVLGALLAISLLCLLLLSIVSAVAKMKSVWSESFLPKRYKPEQKGRATARRRFASHIASEIERINRAENWRDDEFAELEAEVESTGRRRLRWRWWNNDGIVREKSLSKALENSAERVILVEGEPGAGKSVSLRHVVRRGARKASESKRVDSVVPLYINLKDLKRRADEAIDRTLIYNFVSQSIRRINDRSVDEFMDREFDEGLREGSWFFLFDSFDEIPDILSSVENDNVIAAYTDALADFFGGMNLCRGVISSRPYRGPAADLWRKFRVLPLSASRQRTLIERCLVAQPAVADTVEAGVAQAPADVRVMSRNPMLLGLLCEHVKLSGQFPTTAYDVFAHYVDYRFARDAARVEQRFDIGVEALRAAAENIAFCMTADSGIGLSPSVAEIVQSAGRLKADIDQNMIRGCLSALSYMRLGRLEGQDADQDYESFTFAHRRFQEYFATRVVLEGRAAIAPLQLLTDGRWRETAVVLLQTGSDDAVREILAVAEDLLPLRQEVPADASIQPLEERIGSFGWQQNELHVLAIIQAGGARRAGASEWMRDAIGERLVYATRAGNLLDQKLALDVAGAASSSALIDVMRAALLTHSQWLSDIVYKQASRLSVIVPEINAEIRQYIIRLVLDRRILEEYRATKAYLGRLADGDRLVGFLKLARVAPLIDKYAFPLLVVVSAAARQQDVRQAAFLVAAYWAVVAFSRTRLLVLRLFLLEVRLTLVMIAIIGDKQAGTALLDRINYVGALSWAIPFIIAGSFGPSALICIRHDTFPKWYQWPLVTLGALYIRARQVLRLNGRRLYFVSGVAFGAVLCGLAVAYLQAIYWVRIAFIGFMAAGALSLLFVIADYACVLLRDRKTLNDFCRKYSEQSISPIAFSLASSKIKTLSERLKLFQWISGLRIERDLQGWIAAVEESIVQNEREVSRAIARSDKGQKLWADRNEVARGAAENIDVEGRYATPGTSMSFRELSSGLGEVLRFSLDGDKALPARDILYKTLERLLRQNSQAQESQQALAEFRSRGTEEHAPGMA